jgi:hypothetical protein
MGTIGAGIAAPSREAGLKIAAAIFPPATAVAN